MAENGHRILASADPLRVPSDLSAAELAEITNALESALALWRGTPYPELDRDPVAAAERTRLENLRLDAIHDHARVQLALDRPSAVYTPPEQRDRGYATAAVAGLPPDQVVLAVDRVPRT